MRDFSEYTVSEYILAWLFLGGAVCFFIFAAHSVATNVPFDAAEGFGACLMLLGGAPDPKKYIVDCLTFPLSFVERAGRETPLTVIAAYSGFAISVTAALLEWKLA